MMTELLHNAIYDAPIDSKDGSKKYYGNDRTLHFNLEKEEFVTVRFGGDDKILCCEVSDQMGRLHFADMLHVWCKCFSGVENIVNVKENEGGSIGFFKIINCVSDIIVNVDKNRSTRVCCLIRRELSKREFRLNPKNIHFYFNG